MAAGDISIVINSETKAFRQGVERGIIDPLEDAEKALDDLGRSRGPDDLERELRIAQRTTENLKDETERTARAIEREYRDSYRSAGDAAGRFKIDASENMKGFRDEAVQNLSEVASSFDGDLSQMAEGVQGLTGGLASSLTPGIGIPVAILGAAAAAFFASWQKAAEDSEERIKAMYEDFTESGATFVSESYVAEAIKTIQDDAGKWADAQQRVKDTGIEIGTVLRAMAGDQLAISEVHAAYVKQRDDELAKIREAGGSIEEQATAVDAVNAKFGEQTEWIAQIQRDTDTAATKAEAYRDAMGTAVDNSARVRDIVNQIKDRTITIGVQMNNAGFENWWRTVQNRAAQGITVNMRPGQGRAWQ